jgi:hypothetical protein
MLPALHLLTLQDSKNNPVNTDKELRQFMFKMRPVDPKPSALTAEDALTALIEAALNNVSVVNQNGLTATVVKSGSGFVCKARYSGESLEFTGSVSPVSGNYQVHLQGDFKLKYGFLKVTAAIPARTLVYSSTTGALYMKPSTDFEMVTFIKNMKYVAGNSYRVDP